MVKIQRRIEESEHSLHRHNRLAPCYPFVLFLPHSAIHFRRASIFPHSIQLRGHELPEARVFVLYLFTIRANEQKL